MDAEMAAPGSLRGSCHGDRNSSAQKKREGLLPSLASA